MRSPVIKRLMVRGSQVALKHVNHDMVTRTLLMELRRRAIKRWVPCVDMDRRLKIPHSYDTIRYDTIQCNAMQCNAMQCSAVQCNAMQCNAMQYNTIQYNTIQYNTMSYGGNVREDRSRRDVEIPCILTQFNYY